VIPRDAFVPPSIAAGDARHCPLRVVSFDVREETHRRLTSQRGGLPAVVCDDDGVAVLGELEPRWLPHQVTLSPAPKDAVTAGG